MNPYIEAQLGKPFFSKGTSRRFTIEETSTKSRRTMYTQRQAPRGRFGQDLDEIIDEEIIGR